MSALRVGVDIDDVLFPWYDTAHRICEAAGITNGVQPTSWAPYAQYGCTDQDWFDALEAATLAGTLYAGDPIPGTVAALQQIADAGHSIHLVTARGFFKHGHLIREATILWLGEHQVPHHSLTFSKDKTLIRADIFIDDSAANVLDLHAAGVDTWMVNRPHNSTYEHDQRVDHIQEFADMLTRS